MATNNRVASDFLDAVADKVDAYNKEHGSTIPDPRNGVGHKYLIEKFRKNGLTPDVAASDFIDFHRTW